VVLQKLKLGILDSICSEIYKIQGTQVLETEWEYG